MQQEPLLIEKRGRICTFIINRPDKMNSLNPEIMFKLGDTLNALKEEDEVRAVIIRGSGDRAFSSGYDIGRIGEGRQQGRGPSRNPLQYGMDAIVNYPYPVIGMINGYALGAGCHLAATCDLRIAADTASLGMPPAKLGVLYSLEGHHLFVQLIGPANTKELFLTGRRISAQRALEMGLVNQVVPAAELEATVFQLAQEIATETAPLSVKGSKFIINKLAAGPLGPEDREEFSRRAAEAYQSEDLKEARAAFAEKRKPRFIGR